MSKPQGRRRAAALEASDASRRLQTLRILYRRPAGRRIRRRRGPAAPARRRGRLPSARPGGEPGRRLGAEPEGLARAGAPAAIEQGRLRGPRGVCRGGDRGAPGGESFELPICGRQARACTGCVACAPRARMVSGPDWIERMTWEGRKPAGPSSPPPFGSASMGPPGQGGAKVRRRP